MTDVLLPAIKTKDFQATMEKLIDERSRFKEKGHPPSAYDS
jgi:hypothetical protein